MKMKIALLILLLSSSASQYVRGQYKWTVVGEVVDNCGKPVPGARVLIFPPEPPGGWSGSLTITDETADAGGRFSYQRESSESGENRMFLYVTSPLPQNALVLGNLGPPFYGLKRIDSSFAGRSINIRTGEELNLGDIPVQVRYGVVNVHLRNQHGSPLFASAEDWEYIGVRVRDISGRVVEESDISPASVKESVRVRESAIAIILPEGVWRIEIGPDGLKGKWVSSEMLLVKSSNQPLEVVLKAKNK